jgi:hypothetical protein
MKTIYSLALSLLAYIGVLGQTSVYSQDFATFPPQNWYLGYSYDANLGNGPEYEDLYTVYWVQRSFLSDQTISNPSMSVEIYSGGLSSWAISPVIDLSAGGYSVSFDFASGDVYYSTDPTAPASQSATDDVFKFLISQDNGATWQELESIASPNIGIPNTRTTKTYSLNNYTSATTKFALYTSNGTDPNYGVDYTLYFDDFKVTNNNLSTVEVKLKNKPFQLYPNPTKGYAYIKSDKKIHVAEVYDLTGKLISKGKEIDLHSVLAGTYFVKVIFDDGTIATEKIIRK